MEIGIVKRFNPIKGYGFIANEKGNDIFVHYTEISRKGYKTLVEGQCVEYELSEKNGRSQAVNVIV